MVGKIQKPFHINRLRLIYKIKHEPTVCDESKSNRIYITRGIR